MANIASQATVTHLGDQGYSIVNNTPSKDVDGVIGSSSPGFAGCILDGYTTAAAVLTFSTAKNISQIKVYGWISGSTKYFKVYVDDVLKVTTDGTEEYTNLNPLVVDFSPVVSGTVVKIEAGSTEYQYIDEIEIYEDALSGSFSAPTARIVSQEGSFTAPTARIVSKEASFIAPTARVVVDAETGFTAPTARIVTQEGSFVADTARIVSQEASFIAPTARRVAGGFSPYNSLSLRLESKTLSDRYDITRPTAINIADIIAGTIYDFNCAFTVNEVSDDNQLWKATGAYDIWEKLKKPLAVTTSTSAIACLTSVINALGKTASISMDDFSTVSMSDTSPTFRDALSYWTGWTDSIPNQLINVFERGSVIHVLQRGKETESYTIQKSKLTNRTRILYSSLQDSTDSDGNNTSGSISGSVSTDSSYKNGTVKFGDVSMTYTNGLLTAESHVNANGWLESTVIQHTSSTPPARMYKKTTTIADPDGSRQIITMYYYNLLDNEYYLSKEIETEYDHDGEVVKTRTTRHYHLGQDDWGTIVEVDGVTESTSIGQGAPSGEASIYTIENNSKNRSYSYPTASTSGRVVNDITIPCSDQTTVDRIAAAFEWLNDTIQETISLNVYDEHIIDFDKTVIWNSNTYYLESNNVACTVGRSGKIEQQVTLVRWY